MALQIEKVSCVLGLTLFHSFLPVIDAYLLPSFSRAIAIRSLVLRNTRMIRMMASTTHREITAKHSGSKMIQRARTGLALKSRERCEVDHALKTSHVWLSCR